MNERAFGEAVRVFNKTRTGMLGCLRAAIEAYRGEEVRQFQEAHPVGDLRLSTADTEAGPDTALVISGFCSIDEIERFVCSKLYASGK